MADKLTNSWSSGGAVLRMQYPAVTIGIAELSIVSDSQIPCPISRVHLL
jgi:hypothetical protein